MGNEIFIISKGRERVTLPDKQSATNLVIALTVLGCSESLTTQKITGNRQDLEIFELSFLDKFIKIVSLNDSEKVLHWLMMLGCSKIGLEKVSEASEES